MRGHIARFSTYGAGFGVKPPTLRSAAGSKAADPGPIKPQPRSSCGNCPEERPDPLQRLADSGCLRMRRGHVKFFMGLSWVLKKVITAFFNSLGEHLVLSVTGMLVLIAILMFDLLFGDKIRSKRK